MKSAWHVNPSNDYFCCLSASMSAISDRAVYIQAGRKVLERHHFWGSTVTRDEPYGYGLTGNVPLHPTHKGNPGSCLPLPVLLWPSSLVKKRKWKQTGSILGDLSFPFEVHRPFVGWPHSVLKFTFCPGLGWVLLPGNRAPVCPHQLPWAALGPGLQRCQIRKDRLWVLPRCSGGEKLRGAVTQREKRDCSVGQKVVLR